MRRQDLLVGHAGAELTQDLLDGDPGAADHRLAEHDGRIDGDAVVAWGMADHGEQDSRSASALPSRRRTSAVRGAGMHEQKRPHPGPPPLRRERGQSGAVRAFADARPEEKAEGRVREGTGRVPSRGEA